MDEQAIADKIKQNLAISEDESNDNTSEKESEINLARTEVGIDLDEMTQYKLHDYFDEKYKPNDEIARQQIAYIYGEVAKMLDEPEYGFIVAKMRELERVIGITRSENRRYKLYQWMKLNNIRRGVDAQMGAIA